MLDQPSTARSVTVAEDQRREEPTEMTLTEAEYGGINAAERKFCNTHALHCIEFRVDARRASEETTQNFVHVGDGTKTNAFQHSVWVAFMVRSIYHKPGVFDDITSRAFQFARAHEYDQRRRKNFPSQRNVKMDFHNNAVGYRYAKRKAKRTKKNPHGHNDQFLCNRMRKKVAHGRHSHFRKLRPRWRAGYARGQRPKRDQVVWVLKTLPGPSEVIPRMGPDRCAA
jgi:hypothetical protein